MSKPETILRVRGAERHYGGEARALNGADIDLHTGRITALLGPSGSGKSTLLRAVAGLEVLEAGEITCLEEIWSGKGRHMPPEKRRVGMVFQDYALFPHMTALANTAFGLEGTDRKKRAQIQLDAVELGHKANAYPHELSGGEQQRVALARALAPAPAIVLLDEPFSGLDRRLRQSLRRQTVDVLKAAGTAALIVTHDADEAFAVADELALMDGGVVIQTGTPRDVWLNPVSAMAARLVGDVNVFEARVRGTEVETPLGRFDASEVADGSDADVLVRPEAIGLAAAADGDAVIVRSRPHGAGQIVDVETADGTRWQTSGGADLAAGDRVNITIDRQFVRVVAHR